MRTPRKALGPRARHAALSSRFHNLRPHPEERAQRASRRMATSAGAGAARAVSVDTMTDRRRGHDATVTMPPSESLGDIRYLQRSPRFFPQNSPLTPAFRGSFRFTYYRLTPAAESA